MSTAFLSAFHLEGLLVAALVHILASILVGLLYGAILPMFPWEPVATAGFLAPIFWSGLLYAGLAAVNPIMNLRIDWLWFIASQIAFGLVAGFVVNLHVRVRTPQFQAMPFAERAGLISSLEEQEPPDEDRNP
jgi:flagellar biosynthesis protein FliR